MHNVPVKVNLGGPQADPRILMKKRFAGQNPLPGIGFHCQNPPKSIFLPFVVSECPKELVVCQNPLYGQMDRCHAPGGGGGEGLL